MGLVVLVVGSVVLLAWGGFGSPTCLDRIHHVHRNSGSGTARQSLHMRRMA